MDRMHGEFAEGRDMLESEYDASPRRLWDDAISSTIKYDNALLVKQTSMYDRKISKGQKWVSFGVKFDESCITRILTE